MDRTVREELQDVWEVIRRRVKGRISRPMYDMWIAPATGKIVEGNILVIKATTGYAAEWITDRYRDHFIVVLHELTGQDFLVKVIEEQTKTEVRGSHCSLINEVATSANDDCSRSNVKRVSVGIPIITPSSSSMKLRRDNAKITRSLNLPLANSSPSHKERRLYADNDKILQKRKRPRKWWCINE